MYVLKLLLLQILLDVEELFRSQPSMIDVTISEDNKFTVIGDIHGQFYDLMNIFKLNGLPSTNNPYVGVNFFFFKISLPIYLK